MTDGDQVKELVRRLAEVREDVEGVFSGSHSIKFLWRSVARGVDYAAQAARLAALEEKVHRLGEFFYAERAFNVDPQLRLTRAYWCYVFVASSALLEWAEDMDREFRKGSGFDRAERQSAVRRYLDAIGRAKGLEQKLLSE